MCYGVGWCGVVRYGLRVGMVRWIVSGYLGKYVRAMKAASGMRPVSINN